MVVVGIVIESVIGLIQSHSELVLVHSSTITVDVLTAITFDILADVPRRALGTVKGFFGRTTGRFGS